MFGGGAPPPLHTPLATGPSRFVINQYTGFIELVFSMHSDIDNRIKTNDKVLFTNLANISSCTILFN